MPSPGRSGDCKMKKTSYHLVLGDWARHLVFAEPFGPPGAGGCEGPALTGKEH